MNGRCGLDKGIGEFTFKKTSVIDYSIVSAHALKFVSNFNITEVDCLFSDGHSLLSTYLDLKTSETKIKNKTCNMTKATPKWKEDKKSAFRLNIDQNKIRSINSNLCDLHQSNNANKDNINQICTDIGSLFISAAEVTSETSNNIPPKYNSENDKDQKPWFGYKCKNARRKYHIVMLEINHLAEKLILVLENHI